MGWRHICKSRHKLLVFKAGSLIKMAKGVSKEREEVIECLGHYEVRRSG